MRKIISVILAALMLFSVMAVSASAAGGVCNCDDHVADSTCHCCIYCPENPSYAYVTPCHKTYDTSKGQYVLTDTYCCGACKGFIDNNGKCGCNCDCCTLGIDGSMGDLSNPIGGKWEEIWDEDAQQSFVDGFQAILKRISDVFDKIFDAIFEFLRLDEVLPGARS